MDLHLVHRETVGSDVRSLPAHYTTLGLQHEHTSGQLLYSMFRSTVSEGNRAIEIPVTLDLLSPCKILSQNSVHTQGVYLYHVKS